MVVNDSWVVVGVDSPRCIFVGVATIVVGLSVTAGVVVIVGCSISVKFLLNECFWCFNHLPVLGSSIEHVQEILSLLASTHATKSTCGGQETENFLDMKF